MAAWQYLTGAGLVAVLCPLHGHVAVAGDGARVDVCVPAGPPRPGVAAPPPARPSPRPSLRMPAPGAERPTVHHPGRTPEPSAVAARPEPAGPGAKAEAGDPKPPAPAPAAASATGPAPADTPAPPRARAAAAPVSAFHVRPYRAVARELRGPDGLSTMMLMAVVTTPAVLAAAALRPRSKSRG
ncbi:hypothetical protein ABZX75_06150 [Streptomyces sp. NPDC003038]|uniref:hypothetical protein n=1 Tax=unclassified Streptomyces TaxID=2593676 RepID=UPI0033A00376